MKTKPTIPLALFAACTVLATALPAPAGKIELLENGEGTSLDGWKNYGFGLWQDGGTGLSWFGSSYDVAEMRQTVALGDAGAGQPLTASVTVWVKWGSKVCDVRIYELDADGKVLATNTVMEVQGEVASIAEEEEHSLEFVPQDGTQQLQWVMRGQSSLYWQGIYGPLFRNCSLAIVEEDPAPPPEETPLTPRDCSTIVYRGQLNLLGTDKAATNATAYVKTMHFKVYDDEAAETPVWKVDDLPVTVNRDGSFTAMFGDEALAALIATGKVTHVGVAIGPSAGQAIELKPRRALRPVAAVNRALVAEAAGKNPRVGNLVTENALEAKNVTVSRLEVAGTVTAPGAEAVKVAPLVVGERETLTLLRGDGVRVFSDKRIDLGTTKPVLRGQKVGNRAAPSDGIALISSNQGGTRALRIPAVIQYCRKGEFARAPATEPGGVQVTFFPFAGEE